VSGAGAATARYRHYLAVSVAPDGTVYAVGHNGTIARWRSDTPEWTVLPAPVPQSLLSVSFSSAQEGWAVGAEGVIVHTEDGGATWTLQESGTDRELLAMHFIDTAHGWVVGAAGLMLETRDGGRQWRDRSLEVDANLNDVFFLDATTGWVVGEYGVVLKTVDGGASWEQVAGNIPDAGDASLSWEELMAKPDTGAGGGSLATRGGLGENDTLFAVHFADPQHGWATATGGRVFLTRDGGHHWKTRETGSETPLFAVGAACATCPLYACGGKGLVLRSTDGGLTWTPVQAADRLYAYLRDLAFPSATTLVLVGTNGTLVVTHPEG
jgi:photosystem II stability/assembly factor-like uncharacterized protein